MVSYAVKQLSDVTGQAIPFDCPITKEPLTNTTKSDRPEKLRALNQASELWDKADRDDKTTWRGIHDEVIAFLIKRGYDQTPAKRAASIVRPDWASNGRLPDE